MVWLRCCKRVEALPHPPGCSSALYLPPCLYRACCSSWCGIVHRPPLLHRVESFEQRTLPGYFLLRCGTIVVVLRCHRLAPWERREEKKGVGRRRGAARSLPEATSVLPLLLCIRGAVVVGPAPRFLQEAEEVCTECRTPIPLGSHRVRKGRRCGLTPPLPPPPCHRRSPVPLSLPLPLPPHGRWGRR